MGDRPATDPPGELLAGLVALRALVASAPLDRDLPGAAMGRRARRELLGSLDDHLLPRLRGEAPVLVVVAGPTGAGKSTLVNSLVRTPVSVAGLVRPTTRSPVLLCHPDDATYFTAPHVLAGLRRVDAPSAEPDTLLMMTTPAVPRGLALVDAPDVDSVAAGDRQLAGRLLAAADVWLFVTTAARYADAVPWQHLDTARERGAVLVVVVDRVPPAATAEVVQYVGDLLAARGLGGTPVFPINETTLVGGLLGEFDVVVLRQWLQRVAADPGVRAAIVERTLRGAMAALPGRVAMLASAVDEQEAAAIRARAQLSVVVREELEALGHRLDAGEAWIAVRVGPWHAFVSRGGLDRAAQGQRRRRLFHRATASPDPAVLREPVIGAVTEAASEAVARAVRRVGGPIAEPPGLSELVAAWVDAHGPLLAAQASGGMARLPVPVPAAAGQLAADPAARDRAGRARAELLHRLAEWAEAALAGGPPAATGTGDRLRALAAGVGGR